MKKTKSSRFVRCRTKLEAITKSSFKGSATDVLFCIVDDEICVMQGLRMINVSLEHFADGLNIDLIEAQAIVNGGVDSIDEAKVSLQQSKEALEKKEKLNVKAKGLADTVTAETTEKLETLKKEAFNDTKEGASAFIGDFIDKSKERVEKETPLQKLVQRFELLEERVTKLEPDYEAKVEKVKKEIEEVVEEKEDTVEVDLNDSEECKG